MTGEYLMYGCTDSSDPDGIAAARQRSHDAVIARVEELGFNRGPVSWYLIKPSERDQVIEGLEQTQTNGDLAGLRAWFSEHPNGWLVIASVEIDA